MDFPNSKGSYSELQVANTGGMPNQNTSGFSEETTAFLDSLSPEERQKAMEEINAPLTGEDVAEALKQDADYVPEEADYLKFVAFNKSHESSILDGISAGATAVLNDLGAAVGAVADHPMKALATAPASLIEAFSQGTRNLYGMVAQSADPNSILFGFKNALAGDGSPEGYQQFLEARRFNKHSAALASGEETLVMDKGVIDHDLTLAMSYIADPTLFIPFGAAATAGMRAVGMGEKLAMLSARAQTIKAAVIGGGLKWGVGAPIEAMGSVARGVIDKAATVGGTVLETATGISAAELKATAKLSAVGTTTSSILGGHLPIVSDISNVYIGAGAARGFGEAIGAVGEQIQKQGFKRGYNSFAKEALLQTPNLSAHAKGLLKVLDTLDPLMSYGYGMAEGMAHGAVIGGTLGYLNAGEEGLGHGMGAGIALGGVGALGGRMYADATGGTMMARAEVRGGFVIEAMRADKHPNLPAVEAILLKGTLAGDRAGALQVIGGLDRIAPDMRLIAENATSYDAILKAKGLNADGHKVDPVTGRVLLGSNGKPIQFEAPLSGFYGGEGFTMMTEKDGNGKQQVTVVINTDAKFKSTNVLHHELFHAVFKTTVMEPMFRERFAEAILGKFDANGVKIKSSEIDPKELKAFVTRELKFKVDPTTNEQITPAQHKALVDEFDAHLAEYQKAGSTAKMNPDSAKSLNDLVEEFGAHYATQFMKGKPVDYLFHGAEYTGMRGVMDRLHNGFLDFWQKNITKQNPTFGDFTGDKTFDKSFGPNKGKRTLAQRSSAIDYMVQDLLRSVAGKSKGSTNSFDVRTLSPEARTAFLNSSGMDGFRHYFDKDGRRRNLTEDQVKAERLAVGKAVHDSLSKLDPKEVAGLKDVEGSFVANSTVGTKFSDTMLAHLVKEGHISDLLAERIKNIQEITSGNGSNVISYLYKGDSMELEVGPNSRRVYGADVPITSRNTIVVGYEIKVKKDGTMSLLMKGLDKNLIDARGNEQWAKPETRDLWQGDRNEFDKSFFEYLSNASKASTDLSRVESSLLPSLARGDGFGAERRNIMHQFLGMAKRKGEKYFNTPIAEIPRGKTSTVFNSRMDLMSPVRSDLPIRYDFNLDNAHSDLSRNYKVSDMEHEATPQGDVFTHASKYKILADKQGAAHLYDADGKMLGAFKDKDLASKAMEKAYTAERVETDKRIERVIADQQKQQQTFKVWDEETIAKGRELGDIFETDAGKAFTHGTELIRQTREEFYSDNFIKLRQADPEAVMQATEQVMSKVSRIEALKNKLEDDLYSTKETGVKKAIKRQELMNVSALLQRYNDIRLAYTRATKNGQRNGQVILDYINTHRRTSTGYDNMAKVFFGEEYDAQFQTGKPVTTVATHGTDANELLTSKEFDVNKLGSRHMNPNDRVGVFLSGETKTSFGYAEPKEGEFGYRQVRAAVKFNNPFVLDYGFQCFDGAKYDRIFKQARAGGHDGIVIKNVYDGGSADTVFIVMANKVKENTAIIDTHIGMERVTRKSEQIGSVSADSDQGSVRYPIQESMPRGKGVRIGSDLGLSFKGDDATKMSPQDALKEAAFERVIPTAKIDEAKDAGRYEEGVPITRLAGRSVAVLAYDSAGVLSLADKKSGQTIEGAESFGGGMHSVRSEALGFGHTAIASSLRGVNAIIKVLSSVHQKAKLAGEEHYYATILGANPDKLLSSTVGVRASNAHITQLMAKGMLHEKDVRGTLLKIASNTDAFPNLGITEGMTTAEMLQSISAIFARPLLESEVVTAQSKASSFNQKTAFIDALVSGLKSSDSWKANKDGIKKYLGTKESMNANDGIKRALGLSITDPTNFDKTGNLVKNGHMFLALEFITGKDIEYSDGGHPSYPKDIRYKDGTPIKVLRFEEPMLATDAAGSKEGIDIGNRITVQKGYPKKHPKFGFQQRDANGNLLFLDHPAYTYEVPTTVGTGEMKMKQATDMVHRDPNFNTGKNTAELGLKDLLKFKVSDRGQKMFDANIKEFGLTTEPSEAGYILPSGKMLDFSGRRSADDYQRHKDMFVPKVQRDKGIYEQAGSQDWLSGQRSSDHREVVMLSDERTTAASPYTGAKKGVSRELEGGEKIIKMQQEGAIRLHHDNRITSVDLIQEPTSAQYQQILKALQENPEGRTVTVDVGTEYRADFSKGYAKAKYLTYDKGYDPKKVIGDMKRIFKGEDISGVRFKVSDSEIAQVQERVDYLKGLMDRYEKYSTAKGRMNSDNKRRYWDAKREYYNLNEYKLKPMLAERQKDTKPNLKPFEGNFKVSDSVKSGVSTLGKFIDDNADKSNLSPTIKNAMQALREAVRKQDATDEVLVPELRESYDKMVASVEEGISRPSLTPVEVLKELQKTLKPLDKKIEKNSQRISKNALKAHETDMAEGADIEGQNIQEGQAAVRRDMAEGADIESEQALEKRDRQRGDNRLDQEEGADIESEQAYERRDDYNRDQNESADLEASQPRKPVPSPFPYPAPPVPAGLPSYKPSGKPAFPRFPATPALSQVTPSNKPAFPRPPATPALPRGSIAPPPPKGTPAPAPNLPASKPMGKLEGWRGWTLEKGLNGGFWKNAVGWMIIVQGDKFKVYNPQKAMEGIYNNLEQAKLRVRRAEPKDAITR